MATIVSRVRTIALDSSLDLGEIRHRHIDYDAGEIVVRDHDSLECLIASLPRTILTDTENGFSIIAEESHPASKPEPAFSIFKGALYRVTGEPLLLLEIGKGFPVVAVHAEILDREPDVT